MITNSTFQDAELIAGTSEQSLRIQLAAAYRLIHRFNMDDLISTHISVRLPGTDGCFLLSPFGKMFHDVNASSLVKVNSEGSIIDNSSSLVNPAAFVIHSAVYNARSDLNCVFHTHSRYGVAVSALECGLLPISQFSMQFYNRTAYHDYEGTFVSLDDRARIAESLGDKQVMFLRNHGLLAAGRTIAEAFIRMFYLERSCEIQILAQSCGERLVMPPASVCELSAQQQNSDTLGQPEWTALLRMLEQEDRSYRD